MVINHGSELKIKADVRDETRQLYLISHVSIPNLLYAENVSCIPGDKISNMPLSQLRSQPNSAQIPYLGLTCKKIANFL